MQNNAQFGANVAEWLSQDATSLLVSEAHGLPGYGSEPQLTDTLDKAFDSITVVSDVEDLTQLLSHDALWVDARGSNPSDPENVLSQTEISNIQEFLGKGRRAVLFGDHQGVAAEWSDSVIAVVDPKNQAVDGLGFAVLIPAIIHPLTEGVGGVQVAATSLPSGGTYTSVFEAPVVTLWAVSGTSDLVYEWTAPFAPQSMEVPFEIQLEVLNPTEVAQTVSFSLSQEVVSFDSPGGGDVQGLVETFQLDGQPYAEGGTESAIVPAFTSRTFLFTVTDNWNWIEPWDWTRVLDIAIGLALSPIWGAGEVFQLYLLVVTANEAVTGIVFEYEGVLDSQASVFYADVFVPMDKVDQLLTSMAAAVAGTAFTTAGFVALGFVFTAPAAPALFAAEAAAIIASELAYVAAADPQPDYTVLAIPEPIEVPQDCFPEEPDLLFTMVTDLEAEFLGLVRAVSESQIGFHAALSAGSLEFAAAHASLVAQYAGDAMGVGDSLQLVLEETIAQIPIPTPDELVEIREQISQGGLPDIEECILTAFGYSAAELEEFEQILVDLPDELFLDLSSGPLGLSRMLEALGEVPASLEVPEGSVVASIDVHPNTLNVNSNGNWITCYIELSNDHDPGDIDISTVLCNGVVPAEDHPSGIGDEDDDGVPDLMVKFDRAAVIATLEPEPGDQGIMVSGAMAQSAVFAGLDIIRVINPGNPHDLDGDQMVGTNDLNRLARFGAC